MSAGVPASIFIRYVLYHARMHGGEHLPTLKRFVSLRRPVLVRMQPQRQLPVGLLDLVVVGPLVHPEDAVVPLRLGVEDLDANDRTVAVTVTGRAPRRG